MSRYRRNYAYKSGSSLYAFVTNSVLRDNNISIIIEDVKITLSYKGAASYTLYSTVAGLTLINWNNVTFRGNSHFNKQDKLSENVLYLKQGQTLVPLSGSNCTQIHYNVLSKVDELKHGRLNITASGSPPSWSAELYVYPCPMGFILKGDECVCDSFIVDMSPSTKCNITTTTITIYSGQWLGHISSDNKSKLGFASVCPPGNCKIDTLLFNVTDPFSLCESNKMGILCSQCQHNMSVVFGSTECRPCSDLWLITIVGYALFGLLLVAIMLALPLTISEGPLAGIITVMNITCFNY